MSLPESRLGSLYKDFSSLQDLNIEGYHANIETWKVYLNERYLETNNSILFQVGNILLQDLHHQVYGQPRSLDVVLDTMIDLGSLVLISDFQNGLYDTDSNNNGIIAWFSQKLNLTGKKTTRKSNDSQNYLKEETYIIRDKLEKCYLKISDVIKSSITIPATGITDLIFDRNDFINTIGVSSMSNSEQDVMLSFLHQYKKKIAISKNTIKVLDSVIIKESSNEITENDVRIADIKRSLTTLQGMIEKIKDKNVINLTHIKNSELTRETRKEYLKTKIILDRHLARLMQNKDNLEQLRQQIDLAATNGLLVESLTAGKEVMASFNTLNGSTKKVEELLDEIQEESGKVAAINDMLSSVNDENNVEDEEDIDNELAELEKEMEASKEKFEEKADTTSSLSYDMNISQKENDKRAELQSNSTKGEYDRLADKLEKCKVPKTENRAIQKEKQDKKEEFKPVLETS